MMSGIKPISGFPEWLPQEKVIEEDFLEKIRSVFRLHGFCPIETPAVERYEEYNALVKSYNRLVTKLERDIASYNDLVEKSNQAISQYNKESKLFYE